MITTVIDIFREIQRDGMSMSLARRQVCTGAFALNGIVHQEFGEIEIKEGDVITVTWQQPSQNRPAAAGINWTFNGKTWIRDSA